MDDLVSVFKPRFYRKPAIICERVSQTVLTFAERRTGESEESSSMLVMKSGVVRKTFAQATVVWKENKVVMEAQMDGHRTMNPCPVYDEIKKKLFLFFICVQGTYSEQWQKENYCNKNHLCYITSEDLGGTWSQITNLTKGLPEHCVTFAVGPGHGIQTEDGRLIVPGFIYTGTSPNKPVPRALTLYSDDGGEGWQFGSVLPEQSVECQMAEVYCDEGRLIYCNARDEGGRRVEAFSNSNGDEFIVSLNEKLVNTPAGCQGGVVSFPSQDEAEAGRDECKMLNKWLLFSHPTSTAGRCDLGVFLNKSPYDPTAWSQPWIINKGPSSHSDLAYLEDGWFACLFAWGKEKDSEQIALRLFHFMDIQPIPTQICRNF